MPAVRREALGEAKFPETLQAPDQKRPMLSVPDSGGKVG